MPFPLLLLLGASIASTTVLQINEGEQQKIDLDKQAEEEKLSAEVRELGRRQKLNDVLAANIVGVSTSGMSGEGTPESIALANARQASASEGLESLTTRLKQDQLKRQGKDAVRSGRLAATSTLLKDAVQGAQLS